MKPGCTCDTCNAYAAIEKQCRRKSPVPAAIIGNGQLQVAGMWPPAQPGQWCMEHEPDTAPLITQ